MTDSLEERIHERVDQDLQSMHALYPVLFEDSPGPAQSVDGCPVLFCLPPQKPSIYHSLSLAESTRDQDFLRHNTEYNPAYAKSQPELYTG